MLTPSDCLILGAHKVRTQTLLDKFRHCSYFKQYRKGMLTFSSALKFFTMQQYGAVDAATLLVAEESIKPYLGEKVL